MWVILLVARLGPLFLETDYADGGESFFVKPSKVVCKRVLISMLSLDLWKQASIRSLITKILTTFFQKVLKTSALVLKKGALLLISTYQVVLSPYLGGNCRFHPSCSEYSKEAFQKHSFVFAFYLTIRRLFRCHPGGASGYDPVPDSNSCCLRGHHEFAK